MTTTYRDATKYRLTEGHAKSGWANRLLAKLRAGIEDVNLVLSGDSTGLPAYLWFTDIATRLGALFPAYTVIEHDWDLTALDFDVAIAPTTIQTGTGTGNAGGPFTLHVWNGSRGGSLLDYPAALLDKLICSKQPDGLLINYGFNETTSAANYQLHHSRLLALTEPVLVRSPGTGIALIAQYPNPLASGSPQGIRARYARSVAREKGFGLIDLHQAFVDYGSYVADLILPGDKHPSTAGGAFIADRVWESMRYSPNAEPRPQQPSSLAQGGRQLLANGDFAAFTGLAPDGWTLVNCTAAQDSTLRESSTYSVKLTVTDHAQPAYMYQDVAATQWQGQVVTLATRLRCPVGGGVDGGQSSAATARCGLNDFASVLNSIGYPASQGVFLWDTVTMRIGPAQPTVRAVINVNTVAGGGTINVDRVMLTPGPLPKDVPAPLPLFGPGHASTFYYEGPAVGASALDVTVPVPVGAVALDLWALIGAGAGGCGGPRSATGVIAVPGGAGGAGAKSDAGQFPAAALGASIRIVGGAPGAGGAGATTDNSDGNLGANGGSWTVYTAAGVPILRAYGGAAGALGNRTGGTNAAGGIGSTNGKYPGGNGALGNLAGTAGASGGSAPVAPAGGGGAGGIKADETMSIGGNGGFVQSVADTSQGSPGKGGGNTGNTGSVNATNGLNSPTGSGIAGPGGGGGQSPAGTGGNGGKYGGGGGSGAPSRNGTVSGKGGDGGIGFFGGTWMF